MITEKISIYCIECGTEFEEHWGNLNVGHYGFCGKDCEAKIRDKKTKIHKDSFNKS